uniref:Laminin subunit alpha-5 n=1 Tax=Ictidomys tridecemlineatus TaxID=43179 RepID=I3MWP1_ICTTR
MAPRDARLRTRSALGAGGPRGPAPLLLAGLVLLGAARARAPEDGDFSLHPPYFNLAEGARISASATCGEEAPARGPPRPTEDLYCKLVGGPVAGGDPNQTIQGQYCDICTAAQSNKAHPVSNAIDGTERWWQSPPLSRGLEYNEVNVTLDLGQVFHVAYVLIKFANSPRPDLWVLERSTDFGHSYQPWQFFASSKRDCLERFGPRTLERIAQDDHVICTTEYSRIVPLENGEIVVSLVNGRPGARNFSYSPLLRDFTKATNIRLRFLRTNTLLGHLMGKALRDPTVTRRYYYSIKDISIGGRCVCHGHADVCDAKDPADPFRLQCACQHNTCGGSCDRCCPGFNQQPWRPATSDSANECQSCNCHGHAHDCYYDPEVDRRNASQNLDNAYQGGGVCIDCQHHTTGINCERCLPGFYRSPDHPLDSPHVCRRCNCESAFTDGTCEDLTGRCYCRPNFTGEQCDACAEGFTDFPHCYPVPASPSDTGEQVLPAGQIVNCDCSAAGTQGNACRKDPWVGRCVCKPNFQGAHCELCAPGFYGPVADGFCQCRGGQGTPGQLRFPCDTPCSPVCGCSAVGTLPEGCDEAGHCPCRPGFDGPHCDRCQLGHHSYPDCHGVQPRLPRLPPGRGGRLCQASSCPCLPWFTACHCSPDGSLHTACDPRSGQCSCRPRVTGLRCDTCVAGAYNFPSCEAGSCHPAGLAPADPTLPECSCKPHVCGQSCAACKDGFFRLDRADYFGCRCRCDVGGALGQGCEPKTGACRCRPNTQGLTCSEWVPRPPGLWVGGGSSRAPLCPSPTQHRPLGPARDHYLPDLLHLRQELEDAATPEGHAVRFGFNPLEFESFSWRGYAHMTAIQPRIVARLNVTSPDLFRLVFRYVNRGPMSVSGRVSVHEEGKIVACINCTEQSQLVTFLPSTEPSFVTVPQRGLGEPFVLNPGIWTLLVEAEGVLLDYVALLPSAYYEAALLQLRVAEACTHRPSAQHSGENCLLHAYLPLDGFPSAAGLDALCRLDNSLPRPCPREQLSPSHPPLAACLGSDVDVQLQIVVPRPGRYVLVVEYANEDARQEVGVAVHSPQQAPQQGTLTVHPCPYSTLCRGPALDTQHHLATFLLDSEASVRLTAEQAHFFLHSVSLVPLGDFSMELVEPRVRCVSSHGTFGPGSAACLPSRFPKPPQPIVLRDCQVLPLPPGLPLTHSQELTPGAPPAGPQPRPPTAVDPDAEPTLLRHPQGTVVFTTQVPTLGRYAFLLHSYQPAHPTFPVEVLINGGRIWQGECQGQRTWPAVRTTGQDYILVVPAEVYSSSYLREEPLDKSYDFISHCAAHGYHISPSSSSLFCRNAAASLSLFYNNGARPCGCHEVGATGPSCECFGGQCPCRAHVIGRDCSRCATGYWGFPNCRPCDCGTRLCDERTGQCICPPRTVPPDCLVCQPQTFGCHPLVGCEECNCSGPGVLELADPACDVDSGQCRCRPNVAGRRCDSCAPGFHGYPRCLPCQCHEAGTAPSICDPITGHCHCKENVQGPRCDQCRLGTFSLEAANPKGCTRCFCFGATESCRSSVHARHEFVDMEGWTLLSSDRQVVPHEWRAATELLHADLRRVDNTFPELYWQAPRSYLGDRVSSYGGTLRYELHSKTQRGDIFIPTESRPDVVLQGNQMSIMFLEPAYPEPGHVHRGQLQLVEGFHWGPEGSREDPEPLGQTVQGGGPGASTGCQHNTEGDRCERCQAGFVRSSSGDPTAPCVSCPCPLAVPSNNFAEGCVLRGGRTQCLCRPGYAGASCERCAPGFFGNPLVLGSVCQPCDCSGNGDPNVIVSDCDPLTGACRGCLHHTTGPRCERCAPGFYGNALLPGNCTRSLCPQEGHFAAESSKCHPQTGQCQCQPGAGGLQCLECAPGHWGHPEQGCRRKYGQGSGSPVHLDLSTGCQCPEGHCDLHTGRCTCPPGLSGERCDTCGQQHQVPVPGGPGGHGVHCEVCDHCVVLLLDDLERAGALLPALREQLQGVNASSVAWARLHGLNASIVDLQSQLRSPLGPRHEMTQQLQALEQQTTILGQDVQQLGGQAAGARDWAGQLLGTTEATLSRVQVLLGTLQAVDHTLNELASQMGHLSPANASVPSGEQLRQTLAEVERLLQEMRARDLQAPRAVAETELAEAQRLLARVQDQLTSRWEENQALATRTRSQLAQHEASLMDLREALNRAVDTTREAEELNSHNLARLEEALQRKQELSRDNATLQDTLQVARHTLARVSELLHGMDQAEEDLEHLAANLDGARTPLLQKIETFSPAGSKVDLVEAAEAHAQQLDQLAHNLSSIILGVNQDRFIQRAVEASNAYSSILEAVQAAEVAAGQAQQQASRTWEVVVQQGLAAQAQQLLANSSALEEAVGGQQQRLGLARVTLQGARTQLHYVQAKKDQLATQIQAAQAMLAMDTDGTTEKISHAKTVAREAQDTAARVQSQLKDMQRNVERWQGQFGGLQGQDLGQVVLDTGRSVSTLEKTLPQLLAKLDDLENRGGHNASLALSANIGRVRELIAQARGAASKVKVPMKFNGRSWVQLRAPRDLADLAAYTALKFYLQDSEPAPPPGQDAGDHFVLYMGSRQATGDYMGVSLRNQKVHWVYRLGEAGPATLSVEQSIGEQFAAVSMDRTLQFGHMSVTVENQMVHETKGDTEAPGAEGLLSLRPDDFVFYVGGYPSNFTPPAPLRFPGYRGCIEMDTLNEEVISLYNFERTFLLNTAVDKPCARSKSTGDPWLTDGSYLDGTGFARIGFERQPSSTKRFEQELRLVSHSGIIFFLEHQFLCLAVREGSLVLLFDFGAGLKEAIPLQPPPPLTAASKAIQVFLLAGSRKRVLVRVERATVFSVDQDNVLELADAYYLGGVPPEQLPPSLLGLFPSGGSIRGCVKGIKALGKYVDLKRLNTSGISFGCTADLLVGRAVALHGHGFLPLALPAVVPLTSEDFYSGFGFRSAQDDGLLYYHTSPDGSCQVSLQQGHMVLQLLRTEVKTVGVFADGASHYVTFYHNGTELMVYVDDQLQPTMTHQGPRLPTPEGPPQLFLGGQPESGILPNFSGCISNVFVKRLQGPQRVLDLQQNLGGVNVSTGCPPASPRTQILGHRPSQGSACMPPLRLRTIQDAYQFGGPLPSHLEFADPGWAFRSHISMLVRLDAPRGLLLFAAPLTASSPSLALFLSHGHLVAQTEGPGLQLHVQSRQRLRAGRWHTVSVRWEASRIRLLVDGTRARSQKGRPQRVTAPWSHTLFVGGLPVGRHSPKLPVATGLSGCVKGLQLNGKPLGNPTQIVGVTPCPSGPLQDGLFFPGGGVLTLDLPEATLPDVSLELEVRPLAATGLVFHLGRTQDAPYLQLQLSKEQVLLRADDGAGEFATWVTHPTVLCDGKWHRLAAIKGGSMIRLEVDTHSNHTVGPSPGTLADAPAPLHLGGLPGESTAPGRPTFQGCMRKLMVNGLPTAGTRSVGVQGAVGGRGCPTSPQAVPAAQTP